MDRDTNGHHGQNGRDGQAQKMSPAVRVHSCPLSLVHSAVHSCPCPLSIKNLHKKEDFEEE